MRLAVLFLLLAPLASASQDDKHDENSYRRLFPIMGYQQPFGGGGTSWPLSANNSADADSPGTDRGGASPAQREPVAAWVEYSRRQATFTRRKYELVKR